VCLGGGGGGLSGLPARLRVLDGPWPGPQGAVSVQRDLAPECRFECPFECTFECLFEFTLECPFECPFDTDPGPGIRWTLPRGPEGIDGPAPPLCIKG
jgi:hypothetical protein